MLRVQPTALRQLQSRLEKRRYPGGLRASESSGDAIPTLSVGGSKSDLAIVSALAAAPRLSLERRFEAVEALKGLKTAQGREALEEVVTRNKEDIAERVRTSQMEKFT